MKRYNYFLDKKLPSKLKPSMKSTWTIDKFSKVLVDLCNAEISLNGEFRTTAETLSEKYRCKIKIVNASLQKLKHYLPKGYSYGEFNSPHDGEWVPTIYSIRKVDEQ